MQQVNLFEIFILPLYKTRLDYFVTGSIAATIYGEPRLTHDIDIVIDLTQNDIAELYKRF